MLCLSLVENRQNYNLLTFLLDIFVVNASDMLKKTFLH